MKVKDIVNYFQSCNPEYKVIFTLMSPEGDVYKSRKIVEKFRYPEGYVLVELVDAIKSIPLEFDVEMKVTKIESKRLIPDDES